MSCYPVDSADARDRAEADEPDDEPITAPPPRRVPMPPEISDQIRRTLTGKRAQRSNVE